MKKAFALFLLLAGFAYYVGYRSGLNQSGWNYHEGFSDGMRLGPLETERKARVAEKEFPFQCDHLTETPELVALNHYPKAGIDCRESTVAEKKENELLEATYNFGFLNGRKSK